MVLAVKATGDPSALAAELRDVVGRIDPELPVTKLETTRVTVERAFGPENVQTGLVGSFAVLALLLAAVGIYGVVSYAVTQRTPEIGVRMALGASRGAVVGMVVGQGMRFVLAGIALGLAASYELTGLLKGFLFDVKATDALTFGIAPVVLLLVALAANFGPARRAARVDPVVALRYE
jgi:putative ABC transport system permease protein